MGSAEHEPGVNICPTKSETVYLHIGVYAFHMFQNCKSQVKILALSVRSKNSESVYPGSGLLFTFTTLVLEVNKSILTCRKCACKAYLVERDD